MGGDSRKGGDERRGEGKHDQAREEGAEQPARVSESPVRAVASGAQWEPPREGSVSVPELQDVLWRHARNADVSVEDPSQGGGASPGDRDATWEFAGGGRDHRTQIRDHQRVAEASGKACRDSDAGAGQRSALEPGGNR